MGALTQIYTRLTALCISLRDSVDNVMRMR